MWVKKLDLLFSEHDYGLEPWGFEIPVCMAGLHILFVIKYKRNAMSAMSSPNFVLYMSSVRSHVSLILTLQQERQTVKQKYAELLNSLAHSVVQ